MCVKKRSRPVFDVVKNCRRRCQCENRYTVDTAHVPLVNWRKQRRSAQCGNAWHMWRESLRQGWNCHTTPTDRYALKNTWRTRREFGHRACLWGDASQTHESGTNLSRWLFHSECALRCGALLKDRRRCVQTGCRRSIHRIPMFTDVYSSHCKDTPVWRMLVVSSCASYGPRTHAVTHSIDQQNILN